MSEVPTRPCDPVGVPEIAARLGRSRQTVDNWRYASTRGTLPVPLPEPKWRVGGRPAWDWADVEAWAKETGRHDAKDWPFGHDVCEHGVRFDGLNGARLREATACPECFPPTPEPTDDRPVVTLTVTEKRHHLFLWALEWEGRRHNGEALTAKAAKRLATDWLDDQLGAGAYRLETR